MKLIPDLSVLDTFPIASWPYPRVLLGIPLERSISYADQVFHNFMLIASQAPAMIDSKYGRIDVLRNLMAMKLLETDFTHLIMLDVDHVHPTDIIQRLSRWFLIYPEVKVVAGLNFRRKAPYDPVAGDRVNGHRPILMEWDQGLIRIEETGAAAIMISREVFTELEPPWFANIYDDVWKNSWPGEDIYFSRKCAEAGIPIYADTTTTSPHCTDSLVDESTFREYIMNHPEEFVNA